MFSYLLLLSSIFSTSTLIQSCKHSPSAAHSSSNIIESPVEVVAQPSGSISLKPQSMYEARIAADGTALRQGPAPDFKLDSTLLSKGEKVLITDWHDRWRKIRLLSQPQVTGWVHRQMLTGVALNKGTLTVEPQHLEAVYLNKPVSIQVTVGGQEKTFVFARGSGFTVLRKQNEQALIRIPGTQLTQWISTQDAK